MISIFYPPYSFGGDAMQLYRLVNALAERDYEVDVVQCVDSYNALSSGPPRQHFPQHPNVTLHRMESRWGWLSPLLSQQTGRPVLKTKKLKAILLSKKFDVIHFHNISLFGPKVLTLTPDYSDYIKLSTLHEHWLVCPMHVLWKNNRRLCDKPTCLTCTLAFKRPPQLWRYTHLLPSSLEAVDAFIAPSRFTREMHYQRGFLKPIVQIPHFVPQFPLDPISSEVQAHPRPYFLFVGRLEKIKGVQELIPIFRNSPHADLLIAGDGNYEGELRRLAAGLDNVIFLGSVSQAQLPALYRNAIAVIVPSICYEVFGIIIIEAFAQKTPVIVNALGALPEVVEESGGGFVYRDRGQLLEAMERLRTDHELRRQVGEKGYQSYLKRWSEEPHLEMYLRLIETVAEKKFGLVPWNDTQRSAFQYHPEVGT